MGTLVVVDLLVVTRTVPAVQTLNQNAGRVAFEYAFEPVHVDLKVKQVLLGRSFVQIVGDVEFHVLVQGPEAVAKARIFNPLLVGYHEVVKGSQTRNAVDKEVSVARDRTDGVRVQRYVQNRRQRHQRLQVLPLVHSIVVKVQEL